MLTPGVRGHGSRGQTPDPGRLWIIRISCKANKLIQKFSHNTAIRLYVPNAATRLKIKLLGDFKTHFVCFPELLQIKNISPKFKFLIIFETGVIHECILMCI